MDLRLTASGSWDNLERMLKNAGKPSVFRTLERYGQMGVDALRAATPVDEGVTANSWYYEVLQERNTWSIIWGNTHIVDGRPIAVLLQYGHATRNGGWVEGRDYINPALKPIFDKMVAEGWKVVMKV
jgi:hypothetical protein